MNAVPALKRREVIVGMATTVIATSAGLGSASADVIPDIDWPIANKVADTTKRYTGGGFTDFVRKMDLDGKGPMLGNDVFSMRHFWRNMAEGEIGRVVKLKLSDFTKAPGPGSAKDGPHSGEEFLRLYLAPRLRNAISEDLYLQVTFDGDYPPSQEFLASSFGQLASSEEGFTPEELTEHLSARFVKANGESYFGKQALDHMHEQLAQRMRSEGFQIDRTPEWP